MKSKALTAARVVLGLVFFVFGLNGFLHFLPQPPISGAAAAYTGGLAASGYFFPLLKGTEVVAGALLLAGRFVPLALTVLAPIVVHIVAFHLFLAPSGLLVALFVLALELVLAWAHRDAFRALLRARADVRIAREPAARRTADAHAE